jgi:PKD repeat protein
LNDNFNCQAGSSSTNQTPKADFYVSPDGGQAPLTVALDASHSSDSDGSIVSYQWSVNGQTLTGKTVSVTLEKAGDYPITLTVTDDKGASGTKTGALTVSEASNQFCTSGSTIIDNTTTICTNGNCTSSGIKLNCYDGCQWCDPNNNCGNVLYNGVTPIPGGSISCTNGRCSGPGISFNCKNSTSGTNQTPKAGFYVSPNGGQAPLTVALDASPSVDSDGSIVSYQWSVNGQTLTGKTVSVTLEKAGDYPITLTVTDDKGATDTKTGTITVSQPVVTNQPPVADYSASPTSGQAPLTVSLDASLSSDPDGSIVSYQWSVNGQTLTGKTVSVTLEKTEDYPVTLMVTDDKGATDTKTGTITVSQPVATNQPPVADYSASPTSGQAPLTVTLDASSSSDSDGSIVNYQWSVNGQTLSGKTVSVTLDKAGDYPIILTVTDDKGATGTKTDKITVSQPVATNQPPVADYSASPTSGQAPLSVTLDASPSSDSDGSIVSYQWSVNGQTLTDKTVSVTLEKAGDYPVTLMVTDDKGATGNKNGTITVSQPVVTLAPQIRIEPATLTFDNTAGTRQGNRDTNDTPVEIHTVPGNQELFIEDSSRIEENSSDPTITRINYAEVNPYALSQPDATFGTVYAEQVILNLFPDVSFTVNNTSVNYRAENDYTWIGKIEGMPFGDVILVVKDGRITGNINAQGEVYRIRPSQDGWHAIQKMNPAAFPEDAPSPLSFIPPESLPSDEEQRSQSRSARGTRDSSPPIIDVMVVYTPVAAQTPTNNPTHDKMDITSEIQLAVDETNQAYANSAIKQRLRLVHTEQVNYTEMGIYDSNKSVDLHRLSNINDGFIDEVHRLRDEYKADLVSLWVEDKEPPYCGVGYTMWSGLRSKNFEANGFTIIERHCATAPSYAFAHELGHNMGAHHEREALFKGRPVGCLNAAAYSYSCGYVHDTGKKEGSWRTIMAYGTQCKEKGYSCQTIPYFSNPDITYQGIATGDASANNALTLNNTADIVASFRESSNLLTEETKKFTIYNDGNADLVVSAIALESKVAWIAAPKNNTTIPPNYSVTVNVKVYYNQAPSGQSTNRLLVSSNDSTNPSVPVNIVVNRQVDATAAAFAPADVYDGDVQSLSVTAQAGEGTYQAILEPITLQASVIGSVFGIMGYTPIVDSTVGQNQTTYDPLTGIVRIPIGSTYLPTGEPVLFEVEMKETSPGTFEVTNFVVIPVQVIE